MNLKERFIKETNSFKGDFNVLVTAVKLPTGAIEIITNHKELKEKIEYLNNAYDDDFRLKHNKDVQIIGYLIV
jgi:hypothetical protein